MKRTQFVAIGVAKVSKIQLTGAPSAHAGRILDRHTRGSPPSQNEQNTIYKRRKERPVKSQTDPVFGERPYIR